MKITNQLSVVLLAFAYTISGATAIFAMQDPRLEEKKVSDEGKTDRGFFVGGGDYIVDCGDLIEMTPQDSVKCKSIFATGFMDALNGNYAPWYKGVPSAIAIGCHVTYENGDQKVFLTAYSHQVVAAWFHYLSSRTSMMNNCISTDTAAPEHIKKTIDFCKVLNQHTHTAGHENPIAKCCVIVVQPEQAHFDAGVATYRPRNHSQVKDLIRSIIRTLEFSGDANVVEARYNSNEMILMDYKERMHLAQEKNRLGKIGSKNFLKEFEVILRTDGIALDAFLQGFHYQKDEIVNFFNERHPGGPFGLSGDKYPSRLDKLFQGEFVKQF
jgi:hypothetical protein